MLDEAVKEFLSNRAAYLPKGKGPDAGQFGFQRTLIDLYFFGSFTMDKGIMGKAPFGRQPDMSCTVEFEHHTPADHIAQYPVGLDPVPCQAQFF